MNPTLAELDREWHQLCQSPANRSRLRRWSDDEPALAELDSLEAILARRKTHPSSAPAILAALARLGLDDQLAARTLLQALLPGLVRLTATSCGDDPYALEELVSLAWERIATYPTNRPGPVAANVLLDVRKRYRQHRAIEAPRSLRLDQAPVVGEPSAEEVALGRCAIGEVIAAERHGVIDLVALGLILRTRVEDVSLELAAAEHGATPRQANCIRWRAERRLRPVLALAG